MRVLVACEFSGIVRDAFRYYGHEAVSCDIVPTKTHPEWHIQQDVREIDLTQFELLIAHPPCTHLAVSGSRWFKYKEEEQKLAIEFVQYLINAPVEKICIENPVSILSTKVRKPNQYIQPYEFGHPEFKKTGLWLKGLPPLVSTFRVAPFQERILNMSSKNRRIERSITYLGVAVAMAQQWGDGRVPQTRFVGFHYPSKELFFQ